MYLPPQVPKWYILGTPRTVPWFSACNVKNKNEHLSNILFVKNTNMYVLGTGAKKITLAFRAPYFDT